MAFHEAGVFVRGHSPGELAADDDVDSAAGAVVERVRQEVLEKEHGVGLEVWRPVVTGFDKAAAADGVVARAAELLGIELTVIEHQRPERRFVAGIDIVAAAGDGSIQSVVHVAVIETAAPGDALQWRAGTPPAVLVVDRFAREGPVAAADHGVEAGVIVEGLLSFGAVAVLPLDAGPQGIPRLIDSDAGHEGLRGIGVLLEAAVSQRRGDRPNARIPLE